MNKLSTRIWSLLLIVVMILGVLPASALAAETMTLAVSSKNGFPGSPVTVDITLENNPGVAGLGMSVVYGDALILEKVVYNSAMGGQTVQPQTMTSPAKLTWINYSADWAEDGIFATLTFRVVEDAEAGTEAEINIEYNPDDIYNYNLDNVDCTVEKGIISIKELVGGDIDGNGTFALKDCTVLGRYLAGWDVEVNTACLDCNGSGSVNNKDLTRLLQYQAGWDVELYCNGKLYQYCRHTDAIATAAKAATCIEDGNIAYWYCPGCSKYFKDSSYSNEITWEDTVIEATGHTEELVPGKDATYDETGLTSGVSCSACGEIIVEQEEIPILLPNSITYIVTRENLTEENLYLLKLQENGGIKNPNPTTYRTEEGVEEFLDLSVPGFTFNGWYDKSGNLVTEIPAGQDKNYTLTAKWTKSTYEIQYELGFTNVDPTLSGLQIADSYKSYTVDQEKVLPTIEMDSYIFVGWSDKEGEIYTSLPVGTIDHQTLTANWIAERNRAYAKKELDDPLIYEDDDVILYTYEIGEIRDVPLYTIVDYGKINTTGVPVTKEYETQKTTSTEMMESYTDYISKATTESFGWTLSNEWSHSTSIDQEWAESQTTDVERLKEVCTNESNEWYISSGVSGTDTTETIDTQDKYDLTTTTHNERTYTEEGKETRQDFSAGLSTKSKMQLGLTGKLGADVEGSGTLEGLGVNGELGVSGSLEKEVGTDLKYSNGVTKTTKIGEETEDGTVEEEGTITHTGEITTETDSWNLDVGVSGSQSVTNTDSIRTAVSKQINEKYGYGESYMDAESQTQDQGFVTSDTSSKEYSSAVTYGYEEVETEKMTYEISAEVSGYHRKVMAGIAHVFAVVGYSIKDNAYFVNNFTVMDDKQYEMDDYSCESASYNDHQNSIIEFSAPDDIVEHVALRTLGTEGLEVSKAGEVTAYNGTDTFVVIPEYQTITNTDGTNTAIKITSISANAFAGNTDIQLVEMSDFVTTIPDEAFLNCTSLLSFDGKGVTTIGERAFAGCTALTACSLGENTASIGENAFEGMKHFSIVAADKSIVEAAVKSGAKNITIGLSKKCTNLKDMEITIPEGTEAFVFHGYGAELTNVCIDSSAEATMVTRLTLNATGQAPLKFSSSEIVLQEVVVNASGIGLISSAETAKISLYGESTISTEKDRAILCKTVDLEQIGTDYYSRLNVTGNILVCDEVADFDTGYLTQTNGTIQAITTTEFAKYEKGVVTITFNANGGSVSASSMTAYYGDTFADLPVPTKTGFTFVGWFTADDKQIVDGQSVSFVDDIELIAKWTTNAYKVSWNTGTGYSIAVKRTSSPNAGASTGTLTSGATVYYGDVLTVTYAASTGYSLGSKGSTSIVVTGNITSSTIYATATANSYKYNIVYKSSNGTQLGTSSATYKYGTTNTISPKSFTGYTSPAKQSVKWDSTSAKTITFTYTPTAASNSTVYGTHQSASPYMTYAITASYQKRTATSVQVKFTTSVTMQSDWNGYQYGVAFDAACGSANGGVYVVEYGELSVGGTTCTRSTGWITVPLSTTNATTLSFTANMYDTNANNNYIGTALDGRWNTFTLNVNIPAY